MAIELTQIRDDFDEEEIDEEEDYDESESFLGSNSRLKGPGQLVTNESRGRRWSLIAIAGAIGIAALLFVLLGQNNGGNALPKQEDHSGQPAVEAQQQQHAAAAKDKNNLKPKKKKSISQPSAVLSSTVKPPPVPEKLSPLKELQLKNHRDGNALMVNIHVSRNAGDTMCAWLQSNGPVPSRGCYDFTDDDEGIPKSLHASTTRDRPWRRNETQKHVTELKKHFDMLQWTNAARWPRSVNETDWENRNLLSTIVVRHPLERVASFALHFNRVDDDNSTMEEQIDQWWSFINYDDRANNNMLESILGFGSGMGEETPELYVKMAKQYLSRFTIIIDQDCLDDTLYTLSMLLNMKYNVSPRKPSRSPRTIFQDDALYEHLLKQLRPDLELYAWAKTKSIVRCDHSPIIETVVDGSENDHLTARLTTIQSELIQSVNSTLPQSNQSLKDLQVQNYLNGNGLILHSHITHHGGTSVCNWAKANGATPAFACVTGNNWPKELANARDKTPWTFAETNEYVPLLQKKFHLVSWEYTATDPLRSFHATNWLHPNLLSVIVMRDPLDRLQSGREAPKGNVTEDDWWDYARGYQTNNYALQTLTHKESCVKASDTGEECVWLAKRLLREFTVVIDQACFDESMEALSKMLNLKYERDGVTHSHLSAKERIGYDDVYDYLVQRNRRDIELYEWSKSLSIVDCSALPPK